MCKNKRLEEDTHQTETIRGIVGTLEHSSIPLGLFTDTNMDGSL
jgi:hypothetical protein